MMKCNFSLAGFSKLLVGPMATNESIRTLDLSDNGFGNPITSLLIKLLQQQTECKDNKIWSAGLRGEYPDNIDQIGLKSITLRKNSLTDQFLRGLNSWMQYDEYMRHLDLRDNKFEEAGLKQLFEAVRTNKSIVSIEIKGNPGYKTKLHQLFALELLNKYHAV